MGLAGRVVRIALVIVGALALVFALLLLYLWASGRVWYPRQRARVSDLATEQTLPVDEDSHAVAPLDSALPYNQLRMVASHNSYHLEPDPIRKFAVGLVEPEEPAKLSYSHQPLWDQLENGIRSFELDIRARRKRFTVTHVPLVDSRGPHPDFPLTLQEILIWSERRPGHVPIVILLELKSDWMFLDPGLLAWEADTLDRLDSAIRSVIPSDKLLTPELIRGNAPTLIDAIETSGWPSLAALRGMIAFVLHTDSEIDPLYVAGDETLSGRAMFTSARAGDDRPDALFVIHNEPEVAVIRDLVASGRIVRTRADADANASPEQQQRAIASGAQIVSTDRPPGHPNDPERGVMSFGSGATLLQMEALSDL